jgi:outer membrane receptor for ferrienterochelin and colicin
MVPRHKLQPPLKAALHPRPPFHEPQDPGCNRCGLLPARFINAAEAPANSRELQSIQVREAVDEESQYRVGGDVQVITRQEIEQRHYNSLSDAIRRIPGVQISSPGYRASEYGTTFAEEVSLNGDSGVLITVDGRRLDNDASSYGGARSKSRSPLDLVPSIHSVERIEVIKGMGAVAYGSEAAGGVINIVTRRGNDQRETTANVAAGSWKHESYTLTQSGPTFSNGPRYFAMVDYEAGDDTKYRDDDTGRTATYLNTKFHEFASTMRIDQDFGEVQNLSLEWTYSQNRAHYPITAPDTDTLPLMAQDRLPNTQTAPGSSQLVSVRRRARLVYRERPQRRRPQVHLCERQRPDQLRARLPQLSQVLRA